MGGTATTQGRQTNKRAIKIEVAGDLFQHKTYPKIRLQGQWLAAVGFPAGGRVEVVAKESGILELRAERSSPALEAIKTDMCAALERANALLKEKGPY
jgi:hypothetical protein